MFGELPSQHELAAVLEAAVALDSFWSHNPARLLADYSEMHVAAQHEHVIGANRDLSCLLAELRHRNLWPRDDVTIRFVSNVPLILSL